MSGTELEQFFERLLAEPEGVMAGRPDSAARAELLALMRARPVPGASDATTAKLAAYLTGGLDAAETETFFAELVRRPDEIYELEAAQSLLDRIAEQKTAAPPELVVAVLAESAREVPRPATRKWNLSGGGRRWALAGGAMAALVLAVTAAWISENPAAVSKFAVGTKPGSVEAVEAALPQTAAGEHGPAIPVYTAPNPPQALTTHAVTADDYPADSIRLQEQGAVKLQYFIGTDGHVSDCQLIESSGFSRLDEAACVMVRKWQFKPATVLDGSPVAVWMPASIVFALK